MDKKLNVFYFLKTFQRFNALKMCNHIFRVLNRYFFIFPESIVPLKDYKINITSPFY